MLDGRQGTRSRHRSLQKPRTAAPALRQAGKCGRWQRSTRRSCVAPERAQPRRPLAAARAAQGTALRPAGLWWSCSRQARPRIRRGRHLSSVFPSPRWRAHHKEPIETCVPSFLPEQRRFLSKPPASSQIQPHCDHCPDRASQPPASAVLHLSPSVAGWRASVKTSHRLASIRLSQIKAACSRPP